MPCISLLKQVVRLATELAARGLLFNMLLALYSICSFALIHICVCVCIYVCIYQELSWCQCFFSKSLNVYQVHTRYSVDIPALN